MKLVSVSTRYIPPEPVHRILASPSICKNRATLSSCSLVCWSWSLQTSSSLFKDLLIDSQPNRLTVSDIGILRHSPRMCNYIKKLTIRKAFNFAHLEHIM